jgi:hypothetical protein
MSGEVKSEVRNESGELIGVDYTTHNNDGTSKTEHYNVHSGLFGTVHDEKTGVTYNDEKGNSVNYKK